MRRSNLVKGIVKRAITWAMAVFLAFTPVVGNVGSMVVYAEETQQDGEEGAGQNDGESPSQNDASSEEKTETEKQQEAIGEAKDALDKAAGTEIVVGVEAVATIGQGIISQEALAAINEVQAKKDLVEAENAIKDGVEKVEGSLETVDEALTNANTALENANTAAGEANTQLGNANTALDNAQNATTSADAQLAADAAGTAADAAGAAAIVTQEQVDAAKAELDAATTAYNQALADADAANKAAEEAIANASIDAKEAVAAAEKATKKAEALKSEMENKAAEAATLVQEKENALDTAKEELESAAEKLENAIKKEGEAIVNAGQATIALGSAAVMLETAKVVEAIADLNYKAKAQAVEDLKDAKEIAEEDLKKAKEELANNPAPTQAQLDVVATLETAYKQADETYKTESAKLEEYQQKLNEVKAETETDYGKTITTIEQAILNVPADAEDRDAQITVFTQQLVSTVIQKECSNDNKTIVSVDKEEDENGATFFKAVDDQGNSTYYQYTTNTDGTIDVYEYSKNLKESTITGKTVETSDLSVVGDKVEGVDYVKEVVSEAQEAQEAQEALYEVTQKITGNLFEAGKIPELEKEGYTITWSWSGWTATKITENVTKSQKNEMNNVEKWTETQKEIPATPAKDAVYAITYLDVKEKLTGLTEEEKDAKIAGLEEGKDYSVIETKDAYTVVLYNVTEHYAYELTDADKDGSYENLTNKLNAAQTNVDNVATLKTDVDDAKAALDEAAADVQAKQKAYDNALNTLNEKQAAYDSYYKRGGILGLIPSQYDKDLANAKVAEVEAYGKLELAKIATKGFQKDYEAKLKEWKNANAELLNATKAAAKAALDAGYAKIKVAGAEIDLTAAKSAKALADLKNAYAQQLAKDVALAEQRAKEAAAAVEALKGKTNVSAEALKKAEEDLAKAQEEYEKAVEAAEGAIDDAEEAREAYEAALERVSELVAAEEAARNQGGESGSDSSSSSGSGSTATPVATMALTPEVLGANRELTTLGVEPVALAATPDASVLGADRNPQTGDNSNGWLWATGLAGSTLLMAGWSLVNMLKKRR